MTKFQLAPCQSPPSSMVIQMLMLVMTHRLNRGMRAMAMPPPRRPPATKPSVVRPGESKTTKVSRKPALIAVNQEAVRLPPIGMYR